MSKRIAAITTARNEPVFLPRWIGHYGQALGYENLFVILDGQDQPRPICQGAERVNFLSLPHIPQGRARGDRRRARTMSDLARALFRSFDIVMATDADEFLVVDPALGSGLAAYLSGISGRRSVSGLGLDVAQHLTKEAPIDPTRPLLDQRQFAIVSARYTKPVVAFRPVTWGAGLHRIKGHNFHIDPNLYLFHFGMVDHQIAQQKTSDQERRKAGWGKHLERREQVFRTIADARPVEGDAFFDTARRLETKKRAFWAWNKPGSLKGPPVVRIPARFRGLV